MKNCNVFQFLLMLKTPFDSYKEGILYSIEYIIKKKKKFSTLS